MEHIDETSVERPAEEGRVEEEDHATTLGAAVAGAATAALIGTAAGPVGTAIGAVGGAILGAATERVMHAGDEDPDPETVFEDRAQPADPGLRAQAQVEERAQPYDEAATMTEMGRSIESSPPSTRPRGEGDPNEVPTTNSWPEADPRP